MMNAAPATCQLDGSSPSVEPRDRHRQQRLHVRIHGRVRRPKDFHALVPEKIRDDHRANGRVDERAIHRGRERPPLNGRDLRESRRASETSPPPSIV